MDRCPSCPVTLPAAAFVFARLFLEEPAMDTSAHSWCPSYSHGVGTRLIPVNSLHGHKYSRNKDCDPWLQNVKTAAFNPLVSRSRSQGLVLSTPRKTQHCSITMVTSTFLRGNHHPELWNSFLCEDQVHVFTLAVCSASAAQLWLC